MKKNKIPRISINPMENGLNPMRIMGGLLDKNK